MHEPLSPDRQPFTPLQLNIPCGTPAQPGQASRSPRSGVWHAPSDTGAAAGAAYGPESAVAKLAAIATISAAAQKTPKEETPLVTDQASDIPQAASPGRALGCVVDNTASAMPSSSTHTAAAAWPSAGDLPSTPSVSAGPYDACRHWHEALQPCVAVHPHVFATAQHQAHQGIHPASQQSFASGTVHCPLHEVIAVSANGRGHYEQQQHQVLSQHLGLSNDAFGVPSSQDATHPGHTPTCSALSMTKSSQSARTQTQ